MKTPPFLIAAALLFWGWQTDFLLWGALMATILESSRLFKFRLNFSETDLNRIWDLCGLLFAGAYVVIKTSPDIRMPAFFFPQSFPFVFVPMMLAQSFGTAETISIKTFSWLLRWRKAESAWANKRINFSYLYFAICIFGASTTNKFGAVLTEKSFNWFYAGLAVVVGWGLFSVRPRRVPLPLWLCLIGFSVGAGFVAQQGLHQAQAKIETAVGSWIIRMLGKRNSDPNEGRTAIGRIGRLKLSGEIILRVNPADKHSVPDLLRENTYVTYKNESWFATRSEFSELTSGKDASWGLVSKKAEHGVTIHGYLTHNSGILALPLGTSEITNLLGAVKMNAFGTVRIDDGPGFVSYFANFGPGATPDAPPRDSDGTNNIPDKEVATLMKIAHELQIDSDAKSDREKLQIIGRYFENNFSYSTFISEQHVDRSGKKTPLALFLERTHSGHCEYFATATVLLARAANIPARYATGFSVQEQSGDAFIVRERHAHAWALVWRDGSWQNFDTTPASWDKIEEKNASFFEPLSDAWSRLAFEFSKWRYGKTTYEQYLIWALIPLVLVLVWRIVFNKERKQVQNGNATGGKSDWPGLDSEFYLVEKRLAELGLARTSEETLLNWRNRLSTTTPLFNEQLDGILVLHRRYRFDPHGISTTERVSLTQHVQQWLVTTASVSTKAI